jgi:hypothetical protein
VCETDLCYLRRFPVLQLIIIAFCYLKVTNNIPHGEFDSYDYLILVCIHLNVFG